jgi:hypothetical protein
VGYPALILHLPRGEAVEVRVQVTEVQFDPSCIQGNAYRDIPRSAGLHLSTIYADIEKMFLTRDEMDEVTLSTYRAGGFLWERMFESAFADSLSSGDIVRPGEWEADGIIGSPDYIDITRWRVVETKCTWRSSNKWEALEKNFWVWLVQIKGYCRMVGTQEALLHVMFMNGNYKGSGPQIKSVELRFTQNEIKQNWSMITNHARKRGMLPK